MRQVGFNPVAEAAYGRTEIPQSRLLHCQTLFLPERVFTDKLCFLLNFMRLSARKLIRGWWTGYRCRRVGPHPGHGTKSVPTAPILRRFPRIALNYRVGGNQTESWPPHRRSNSAYAKSGVESLRRLTWGILISDSTSLFASAANPEIASPCWNFPLIVETVSLTPKQTPSQRKLIRLKNRFPIIGISIKSRPINHPVQVSHLQHKDGIEFTTRGDDE